MADIANIRRRRLERLANNSVPVAAAGPEDASKSGGMMMEPATTTKATQDSTIPSEFECILCLRCVCRPVNAAKGEGVGACALVT